MLPCGEVPQNIPPSNNQPVLLLAVTTTFRPLRVSGDQPSKVSDICNGESHPQLQAIHSGLIRFGHGVVVVFAVFGMCLRLGGVEMSLDKL